MSNLSPLGKTARSPSGRIIRPDPDPDPDSGSPFRPMTPMTLPVRRFPPSLRGRKRRTDISPSLRGRKRRTDISPSLRTSNPKKSLKIKSKRPFPNHGFKKSKSKSKSQSRRR